MGNICQKCFKLTKKNKLIHSDLSHSLDMSIEDYFDDLTIHSKIRNPIAPFTVTAYMQWLTDQEKNFMEDDDGFTNDYSINNTTNIKANGSLLSNGDNKYNIPHNIFNFDNKSFNEKEHCVNNENLMKSYFNNEFPEEFSPNQDLFESNDPCTYEEEIDGPELARLIKRMKPADFSSTSNNRDSIQSCISACSHIKNSNTRNLNTKINQNLSKGINQPVTQDQKRTDNEDLIRQVNSFVGKKASITKNPYCDSINGDKEKIKNKKRKISSTCEDVKSSTISPMDYTEEMVWDMGDIYSANLNRSTNNSKFFPKSLLDDCSSNSLAYSDKHKLLSN